MLVSLLIGLQASPAVLPRITVAQANGGYRAEVGAFTAEQGEAVHEAIARQAARLCAEKHVKWGEFGSTAALGKDLAAPPKVTGYFQEFRCLTADQRTSAPAPDDWKPTASDEADVRRAFDAYYRLRDGAAFAAALAAFHPSAKPEAAGWPERMRTLNAKLGSGKRQVVAVTWYVNPASAEVPGVYAALDFVGDYPRVHFYCGYLVLYRSRPGEYQIAREEQNIFHRADGEANPDHLAQMRAAACRGN